MKRMTVFSLTLLLLVSFFSICASSDIAFARNFGSNSGSGNGSSDGSTYAVEVAILDCQVSPPTVKVVGFSQITNPTVTLTVGDECAQDLAALLKAGFKIKNVQTVNSTNVVYTLISKGMSSDD